MSDSKMTESSVKQINVTTEVESCNDCFNTFMYFQQTQFKRQVRLLSFHFFLRERTLTVQTTISFEPPNEDDKETGPLSVIGSSRDPNSSQGITDKAWWEKLIDRRTLSVTGKLWHVAAGFMSASGEKYPLKRGTVIYLGASPLCICTLASFWAPVWLSAPEDYRSARSEVLPLLVPWFIPVFIQTIRTMATIKGLERSRSSDTERWNSVYGTSWLLDPCRKSALETRVNRDWWRSLQNINLYNPSLDRSF